ncbi:MAG: KEOPS complex subunit Pcc1 [Halorhabdus sp.]
MDHEAVLEFEYPDVKSARIVEHSVAQEVDEIGDERTTAAVARDGQRVIVTVSASDLVALRAGLNTWTGLVTVAEASGL